MKVLSQLGKTNSFRGFLTLFSGNIGAVLINLLAYPVMSRFYSAETFGIFSLFQVYSLLFAMFLSGQLYTEILRAKPDDIPRIANGVFTIATINLAFGTVVALFLGGWFFLVPVTSFFMFLNDLSKAYYSRKEEFAKITKMNLLNRSLSQGGKALAGAFNSSFWSLMLSELLGVFASSKFILSSLKFKFSLGSAWRLKGKVFYYLPYGVFNFLIDEWVVLVLANYLGLKNLGFYFLFSKVVLKPFQLVGNAISGALVNYLYRNAGYRKLLIAGAMLLFGSCIAISVMRLWGEGLFSLLLGEEYRTVGTYASVLSFLILPKLFKGVIFTKSVQVNRKKLILGIRFLLILGFVFITVYNMGRSSNVLTVLFQLALVETAGEFLNMILVFWSRNEKND